MRRKQTDWKPKNGEKDDDAWTHTGAHEVTEGEVDGDVEFDDELKERSRTNAESSDASDAN